MSNRCKAESKCFRDDTRDWDWRTHKVKVEYVKGWPELEDDGGGYCTDSSYSQSMDKYGVGRRLGAEKTTMIFM